jgi:hypothetical protein
MRGSAGNTDTTHELAPLSNICIISAGYLSIKHAVGWVPMGGWTLQSELLVGSCSSHTHSLTNNNDNKMMPAVGRPPCYNAL